MEVIAVIFVAVLFVFAFSLLEFLIGLLLVKVGFPRYGVFIIGMSGFFPSLIPKYCPCQDCSGNYRCRIWTCPRFNVKKD